MTIIEGHEGSTYGTLLIFTCVDSPHELPIIRIISLKDPEAFPWTIHLHAFVHISNAERGWLQVEFPASSAQVFSEGEYLKPVDDSIGPAHERFFMRFAEPGNKLAALAHSRLRRIVFVDDTQQLIA